ncbi:hypothetical protein [Bufonid herpesvirus 1]|uniref:hypothetical protein n=1 Tax=Bufonid herpesvirus 1 TaxID=2282206 RepID=UPI000EB6AAE5|nr:hypothetical protein [Bufonid herpesvirus 1]AXF48595.1 hypothetical protein [Bufonid herpesvirus 1]
MSVESSSCCLTHPDVLTCQADWTRFYRKRYKNTAISYSEAFLNRTKTVQNKREILHGRLLECQKEANNLLVKHPALQTQGPPKTIFFEAAKNLLLHNWALVQNKAGLSWFCVLNAAKTEATLLPGCDGSTWFPIQEVGKLWVFKDRYPTRRFSGFKKAFTTLNITVDKTLYDSKEAFVLELINLVKAVRSQI